MKQPILYSANQIAAITGFRIRAILDKIAKLKLAPEITKQRVNYYDEQSYKLIALALQTERQVKTVTKYYPLKTTETFYIYESKMNN